MLGPIGLPVGAIASWMRGTWLGLAAMPARWRSRISRA